MKVRFVPQNVEFEIKPGQSVMHVAQDNNLYVKSVCKGVPSCAECRVRVVNGEHNILPPGSEELSLIGTGHFIDRRRLSCQLKCFGDITVDLSEQIAKEKGLIGGKKSRNKLNTQDDRVEANIVRTSEENETSNEDDTNEAKSSSEFLESPTGGQRSHTQEPEDSSQDSLASENQRRPDDSQRAPSQNRQGPQQQREARPQQQRGGGRPRQQQQQQPQQQQQSQSSAPQQQGQNRDQNPRQGREQNQSREGVPDAAGGGDNRGSRRRRRRGGRGGKGGQGQGPRTDGPS